MKRVTGNDGATGRFVWKIPLPTEGSFTYDSTTPTFSDFTVDWGGLLFTLTDSANHPSRSGTVPCLGGLTGAAASFALLDGACSSPGATFETNWSVSDDPTTLLPLFAFYTTDLGPNGFSVDDSSDSPGSGVVGSMGSWTISPEVAAVPEPCSLIPITLLGLFAARKRIARSFAQAVRRAARLT
jgi:hypothetical protein